MCVRFSWFNCVKCCWNMFLILLSKDWSCSSCLENQIVSSVALSFWLFEVTCSCCQEGIDAIRLKVHFSLAGRFLLLYHMSPILIKHYWKILTYFDFQLFVVVYVKDDPNFIKVAPIDPESFKTYVAITIETMGCSYCLVSELTSCCTNWLRGLLWTANTRGFGKTSIVHVPLWEGRTKASGVKAPPPVCRTSTSNVWIVFLIRGDTPIYVLRDSGFIGATFTENGSSSNSSTHRQQNKSGKNQKINLKVGVCDRLLMLSFFGGDNTDPQQHFGCESVSNTFLISKRKENKFYAWPTPKQWQEKSWIFVWTPH